ncbi:hypothetical protein [Sodalis sp. RH19]|uniref:hypothetical protein n=1 Tax=Sodalis sp. RH19 TaxID=3394334 RepID=UPI0039B5AA21
MAKPEEPYCYVVVESFIPNKKSGKHGKIHIRPVSGQSNYPPSLQVECSKQLSDTKLHPVGTKFKIRAKLTDREDGGEYLYSSYRWAYEVVKYP